MYNLILTFIILFVAIGAFSADNNILQSCDLKVIGKSRYSDWLKRNFSYGKKVCIENHTFSLPDEVDQMNCSTYKADLNNDQKSDYVLAVAGTGNGRFFGMCDIYIFVSCPKDSKEGISFGHIVKGANGQTFRYMYMPSYGVKALKGRNIVLLEGVSLSEDRKTHIKHYYAFDKEGWAKEVKIRLCNSKI